jgi:HSP20 family protein
MSTLVTVPKTGGLTRTSRRSNFPNWSSWIDDIFNDDMGSVLNSNFNQGITLPKVNIKETENDYFLNMAVPGMKKSDFHIDIENELLSISTEIKDEEEIEGETYTRREYGYASFKRTFSLPESVNETKIKASYVDGILSIQLPKREEAKPKPARSIKIS